MPPKPERRPEILNAAAKLWRERGYQATSMDDLAAALGLNKATVYHHFTGGKPSLLFEIYVSALDDLWERINAADPDAAPVDRLRQYIDAMIRLQFDRPDATVVYFQERPWLGRTVSKAAVKELVAREAEVTNLLAETIEGGMESGHLTLGDPRLAAATIINVVSSAHRWGALPRAKDADARVDYFVTFTMAGLGYTKRARRAKPLATSA